MRAAHAMRFGAELLEQGGVRFALWAPARPRVTVELVYSQGGCIERRPMQRGVEGWHECVWTEAGPGTLYRFDVGQGRGVPDPASRCNPLGVHGPSEVVDPHAYEWGDGDWRGLAWHRATVYELHVGCFTPEGTLQAAAARLPYLQQLGIRAIEVMPLAAFSGHHGWGYDGVLPFAVHPAYGTPQQLKHFVDTAHQLGLMVLLDVVYNHFGPDGNYLHAWCPQFYDARRSTPWGPALRFEGEHSPTVRRFFIDNALYWVEEYRFDGLRLDAVHAMQDRSPVHLVEDIAAALHDGPGRQRHVHLLLENDANNARWLARDRDGWPRTATAQWNDDWHHAAHVLASGESEGYYRDYREAPVALLAQALAEGFVYQGQPSPHRGGQPRGEPSAELPSQAFVAFLQNHDQVGNRAFGERIDALAGAARVETLLACLLLAPQVPMLFMGEEFAASTPFLYFCDFDGALAAAVRNGRCQEFAEFAAFGAAAERERIPDPNDAASFAASRLRWEELDGAAGRRRLALVTQLLALRREQLEPHLPLQRHGGRMHCDAFGFHVEWPLGDELLWTMRACFGGVAMSWPIALGEREVYRNGGAAPAPLRDPVDQVLVTLRQRYET
jgi:maltooligosyltrehalose trehalohydrolase